ncbi:scamp family-domain-containing protein [Blastocladiella britannica]|nr:scamp family-domain-containing protein [Blastocladiella britannica]
MGGGGRAAAASAPNPWSGALALQSDDGPPAESAAEAAIRYREKELERREQTLANRENALKDREEKVDRVLERQMNWPPFRPILYHSIEKEIPPRGQGMVRRMYSLWMFAVWTYVFNCVACFTLLVTKNAAGGGMFGMSLLIAAVAVPVSWSFWYRQLYNGTRDDKSIRFFLFFINFAFHLGASGALLVGIPGWGGAGVIVTLEQFSVNLISAIFCVIASASLGIQLVLGIWGLKDVTMYYRSMGMSLDRAKQEAAVGVAQSSVGQSLLKEGAKQAIAAKTGQAV